MTAASTAAAAGRGPAASAARLGLARGGIEIWQTLTYWPDLLQALFFSAVSVVALVVMRGHHVPGTTFSLGSLTLPGVIGMNIAVGGVTGVTALLAIDREDGTLLRAKATPGGMSAYVIGKIVLTAASVAPRPGADADRRPGRVPRPARDRDRLAHAGLGGGARAAGDDTARHPARVADRRPPVRRR